MVKTGKWVKLYGSTLDSSIWQEDESTRLVWMTMLMLADWDGRIVMTASGLARRARVSRECCDRALEVFLAPDAESTDGTSGERIEVVDQGWVVLNVRRYRDERTPDQLKKGEAMRRWRADKRKRDLQCSADRDEDFLTETGTARPSLPRERGGVPESESGSSSGLPDSGSEGVRTSPKGHPNPRIGVDKPVRKRKVKAPVHGFDEFWEAFDKKRSRVTAEKSWQKIAPSEDLAVRIWTAARTYAASTPDKKYRKDPTTWLNQECWNDEVTSPVAAVKHIPNMPLGAAGCTCAACVKFRAKQGAV